MAYTKPQVIAQNTTSGSYAAGCPANSGPSTSCGAGSSRRHCELGN